MNATLFTGVDLVRFRNDKNEFALDILQIKCISAGSITNTDHNMCISAKFGTKSSQTNVHLVPKG